VRAGRDESRKGYGNAYEGSNSNTCGNGGDRTSADVACDAAAGCEGAEDETDGVEGSLGVVVSSVYDNSLDEVNSFIP
jgi:hypothetical protein